MARQTYLIGIIQAALFSLLTLSPSWGQISGNSKAPLTFSNLTEVLDYASGQSMTLKNNTIKLDQARKAKLAAALGTIDITGNLLSAQFTDNTQLGVNLFPEEIFGDAPGTYRPITIEVRYNTNLTNYADIKLVNPTGWSNLKLSKINIDLTETNNQLSLKSLHENIAANYFNIVNLQEQIVSTQENLAVADTLLQITQHKFEEGLATHQDVNESKINVLTTKENIKQMNYLLEQYYISLKLLCDIDDDQPIDIQPSELLTDLAQPAINASSLNVKSLILQEQYAKVNYRGAKAAFMPTLSMQLSNSNNLYNTDHLPPSGEWVNSNYIGLNLSIPIPGSQQVTNKYNAQFEYEMAKNNTKQAMNQASLDQQSLQNDYDKAMSQRNADAEILTLREETFRKNQNLYQEGVTSLDKVLNSFNAMVNAQYNLIASEVNVQLAISKIHIHNK